jgi:hypothetical protein
LPPAAPSDPPNLIVVESTLDFNVDEANLPLSCEDYYRLRDGDPFKICAEWWGSGGSAVERSRPWPACCS